MSRDLTSGMVSVTTADVVRPAYFVRMQFDSNDSPSYLNVWSGVGDLALWWQYLHWCWRSFVNW